MAGEAARSEAAAKMNELGLQFDANLPYRLDRMFPKLEGWGVKGAIKQKHKVSVEVYGVAKKNDRLFLHASVLHFTHPKKGCYLRFSSLPPLCSFLTLFGSRSLV